MTPLLLGMIVLCALDGWKMAYAETEGDNFISQIIVVNKAIDSGYIN